MGAFLIVAIICVLLATVYMFRLFPHPSVLKQPLVCAHIGSVWFVSLLPIALVPADVWKAINTDASDEGILPALWIVAYIYPMVTQLVTMPMHQEIDAAKDFTLKARWKTALKINGRLYAILGGIGILGLLLLIVTGELNSDGVVGFVIAFSNTLGLTLGILLFGYGLVDVPRKLWASANWPEKKRYLLYKVAKGHEKVIKSHFEVSKMMVKVQDTSSQIRANNPLRPEMDIIVAEASEDANFQMATNARQSLSEGGEYDAWEFSDTVESLADLRTLLFKAQRSFFQDSSHLIYNAEKVLDLDDNSASAERADGTFTSWRASDQGWLSTKLGISTEKWSHWEYIWKCKLQRPAYRALSIIFGISSVLMVQSECLILYEGNPYLAVVALWTHQGNQCQSDAHTGIIIGSLLPVMYVFFCTFYSLFRMGVISLYFLVPGRSDTFSLFYNAMFMSRFAPAMSYNFLRMAKVDHGYCFDEGSKDALPAGKDGSYDDYHTSFHNLFGESLDAVPILGKGFQRYFPSIIVFYCLSLIFRLTDRILGICFRSSRIQIDPDSLAEDGTELEEGDRVMQHIRQNAEQGEYLLKGAPFGIATTEDGLSKPSSITRPPSQNSLRESGRKPSSSSRSGSKPTARDFTSLKDRLANARQAISEGRRPTYQQLREDTDGPTELDSIFDNLKKSGR
mmetsp:Transcript_5629/g.20487  ORF Transcript_5629/g.20487 Transcript_5629/m.20487 type:complete len:681 (-) Transcript_5629:836-2878(-)